MSDSIADMLTSIRNAYLARKKLVTLPYSRIKDEISQILVKEGFLVKSEIQGIKPAEKKIILTLKYRGKKPILNEIKMISKPGLRVYVKAGKIPPIRLGFGVSIVSTSGGLMTDREARKRNLGGELICQAW